MANQFWDDQYHFGDGIKGLMAEFDKFKNWVSGATSANRQYEQNLALQENQQAFNSAEAEKDRQFQAEQEGTRYQRTAADLRAAGLNPWLAAQGSMSGGAASGATATSSAGSVSQTKSGAETVGSMAQSAASIALIAKIIKYVLK